MHNEAGAVGKVYPCCWSAKSDTETRQGEKPPPGMARLGGVSGSLGTLFFPPSPRNRPWAGVPVQELGSTTEGQLWLGEGRLGGGAVPGRMGSCSGEEGRQQGLGAGTCEASWDPGEEPVLSLSL